MPGYYDLVARQPGLAEIAAVALDAKRRRDASELQRLLLADTRQRQDREFVESQKDSEIRRQAAQQQLAAPEQERLANVKRYLAQMLEANPGAAEQVKRIAEAQGIDAADIEPMQAEGNIGNEIRPVSPVASGFVAKPLQGPGRRASTAEELQPAVDRMNAEAMGVLGPPGRQPPRSLNSIDEAAKIVINQYGLSPGDDGFSERYAQVRSELERENQARARAGATTVRVGGDGTSEIGLTTQQQSAEQAKVIKARERLVQLSEMRRAIESAGGYDSIGAYKERMSSALGGVASKAGMQVDGRALADRASAIAAIGGFTNPIISELSGANVPEAEMERMKESLPRPDDAGPVLRAKIDAWERNLRIIDKYGVDYLVKGIRAGEIQLPTDPRAERARKINDAIGAGKSIADLVASGLITQAEGVRLREKGVK